MPVRYERFPKADPDRAIQIFNESGIAGIVHDMQDLLPEGSVVRYDNGPVWKAGTKMVADTYPRVTISTPEMTARSDEWRKKGNSHVPAAATGDLKVWNVLEIRGSEYVAGLFMFIHERNRSSEGENSGVKMWSDKFSHEAEPKDIKAKLYGALLETFDLSPEQDERIRGVLLEPQRTRV